MNLCKVDGCERPVGVIMWQICRAHYEMKRRREFVPRDTCSVETCQNGAMHCGLCKAHYSRLKRYGSPTGSKPRAIAEPVRFVERAIAYNGSDCLTWPYGKFSNGYGYMHINGKMVRAHRIVCERAYGPSPFEDAQAAHSCRVPACVNPRHLRWDTPLGNMADQLMHGTRQKGEKHSKAKLTEADIRVIRASSLSQNKLASMFGVAQAHISAIQLRKAWKHVP